jgi:hypothetical protein
MEVFVNDLEYRQETLCRPTRLVALYDPLSLAYAPMRILNDIVEAFVLAMLHTGQNAALSGWITPELVGDQHPWHILTAYQQFAEKADRGLLVPARVHHEELTS